MRYCRAEEIDAAVRRLYEKNGYVVLSEVRNGTGFKRAPRTADMMIASTWPSRGLHLEGVEIKVSRSDLKSELACPEKADALAKYCKWWWLAVPDDLLTPDMMIPDNWGIITVDDKGKAAISRRGSVLDPAPPDILILCSILRNFSESYVHSSEIEPRIQAAKTQAQKEAKSEIGYRFEQMETALRNFQESSGVQLLKPSGFPVWDLGDIGAAVKTIMAMRHRPAEQLEEAAEILRKAGDAIRHAMQVLTPPPSESIAPSVNSRPSGGIQSGGEA